MFDESIVFKIGKSPQMQKKKKKEEQERTKPSVNTKAEKKILTPPPKKGLYNKFLLIFSLIEKRK